MRTSDCTGITNPVNRNTFTAASGWLRLDSVNAGNTNGDFSGQPLLTSMAGELRITTAEGHTLHGTFSVAANITSTDHNGIACSMVDADVDNDMHVSSAYGGDDCNDNQPTVYPGAPELCDRLDNNCDSLIDNLWTQVTEATTYSSNSIDVFGLQENGLLSNNSGRVPGIFSSALPNDLFVEIGGFTYSATVSGGCGIRTDRTISCFGDGILRRWSAGVPSFAGSFVQISVGDGFVCARDQSNTGHCWNPAPMAIPNVAFTDISAGRNHACGVTMGGSILCWGGNEYGESTAPSGTNFAKVSAGREHTCGLRSDGTVLCWGGTLIRGCGAIASPSGAFVQIDSGWADSCGIRTDGTLVCWDCNPVERQPLGSTNDFAQVLTKGFLNSSGTNIHRCAVKRNKAIECVYTAGNGITNPIPTPVCR